MPSQGQPDATHQPAPPPPPPPLQVVDEAPETLLQGDVAVVAEFLAGKLRDWCGAAGQQGSDVPDRTVQQACTCAVWTLACLLCHVPLQNNGPVHDQHVIRRACIAAAAPGCTALLRRVSSPTLAPLPDEAAIAMVRQLSQARMQGVDYRGRLACYELLLCVLQV